MFKLAATVFKEILLLSRDRAGLLVLFFMPAVLVLVISLVQENVLKTIGETSIQILFIDEDGQSVGQTIEKQLRESGSVEIIKELGHQKIEEKTAIEAIRKGDYQLCILIPKGISETVTRRASQSVKKILSSGNIADERSKPDIPELVVFFDPAVRGNFRSNVINSLKLAVLCVEIGEKIKLLSKLLPEHINGMLRDSVGSYASDEFTDSLPEISLNWNNDPLMEVTEKMAFYQGYNKLPTSVQQNVPAWALFGMFFIVVPMAGSLIRERQNGTLTRLLTMPVSYLTILSGKVIAYLLVCLSQFLLIVCIGKYMLPLMGTSTLEMGSDSAAVLLMALSASLAASGYGIMLGAIVRTYEQASMFGPISIVIAAALGGIMVPVYAMPKMMQKISIYSPLAWGLNGFHDIFARGGNIRTIFPEVLSLISFFAVTMLIAWFFMLRRD